MGYIWLVKFEYILIYAIKISAPWHIICIGYKTWPDPLHQFSGQPRSTSSLVLKCPYIGWITLLLEIIYLSFSYYESNSTN